MSLVFISRDTTPTYTALSTDISANKITGATIKGGTIYLTDTKAWKIIESDLTLIDYSMGVTITSPLELNGAIPVNIQDQHTEVIDFHIHIDQSTPTLASNVSIDDTQFTLTAGHSVTVGQLIYLHDAGRCFEANVLAVAVNLITVDSPLDYPYTTASSLLAANKNLNVDGSVTPVVADIGPPAGVEWDIVRILFYIQDGTAMDDSTFGGLTALTTGVVLRVNNTITKNIFNVKSNGELSLRCYDTTYTGSPPAGSYGLRSRRTFGGQSKNGVTLRLVEGDKIEIIIQDNLIGLEKFNAVIQGHVVTD